jgi:hypothetical protein
MFSVCVFWTRYLAPESEGPEHRISPKSDVFALGIIVVQMCCKFPNPDNIHHVLSNAGENVSIFTTMELFKGFLTALDGSCNEDACRELLRIGLECCQRDSKARPLLVDVLRRMEEMVAQVVT